MSPRPSPRRALVASASAVVVALGTAACKPLPPTVPVPPPPPPTTVPSSATPAGVAPWTILGPSSLSAAQLTAWFNSRPRPSSRPPVPIADLARFYIEEGQREGVAGDRAFIQAVLETGWFSFSTRVPPTFHNFAGIGAVDGGTTASSFPDARSGVRAQIQHLRAYATPGIRTRDFASPIVAERTRQVLAYIAGRADLWSEMGDGNWATDALYAEKIDRLYREAAAHAGVKVK